MGYCTMSEVRIRMGQEVAQSASLEERIVDAIAAATTAIDNDTRRTFTQVEDVKTFGVDGWTHDLQVPDLVSITTLKLDDAGDGNFGTTIADTDYELDTYGADMVVPFEIVRLLNRCYPYGSIRRRRIEIDGTWGWPSVPAPINQACSLLAVRLVQRPQAPFGMVPFEGGATNMRNHDPDYMALIAPYVLIGSIT